MTLEYKQWRFWEGFFFITVIFVWLCLISLFDDYISLSITLITAMVTCLSIWISFVWKIILIWPSDDIWWWLIFLEHSNKPTKLDPCDNENAAICRFYIPIEIWFFAYLLLGFILIHLQVYKSYIKIVACIFLVKICCKKTKNKKHPSNQSIL